MPRESFVVQITSVGAAGYETHVRSPAGETTATCDLRPVADLLRAAADAIPAGAEDWRTQGFEAALQAVDQTISTTGSWQPEVIGEALYHAIFVDKVQRLFDQSRGLARSGEGILPIELRFELESPHQARLATLPWELLYDPEKGAFLAQLEETPITRYLSFDGRIRRLEMPDVLRVLVVAAAPSDLVALQWDRELEILSGWPQANIVIDHLEQPTRQQLRRALRRGYHVMHFLGHGTFDAGTGDGSLTLVDEHGRADWVPGTDLARWVVNSRTLRLVVLNACNTAQGSGPQPFAGVASALVHGGVAATLAMRRPIPDGHAVAFARVLYSRLTQGQPLDAALSSARQELAILDPNDARAHWATPTLYAHTNDVFYIPVNLKKTLTRVFSWLGVVTANIAGNAWMQSQTGPQLPGFDFSRVNESTTPVFGVLLVAPLLVPLLLLILRYQRGTRERGLFHRLPIAFAIPIGDNRFLARSYQVIILLALVAMPVFSQVHFQRLILGGESWSCHGKPVTFAQGAAQHLTRPTSFGVVFEHKYCFGPKKTDEGKRNPVCAKNSERICEVTFFPFWEPWILLLADLYIFVLSLAVLWGIWAREPLFRTLHRPFRRLSPLRTP